MTKKEGLYFCSVEVDSVNCNKLEYIYFGLNEFKKPLYERNP
jgi:hypothetical protein